MQLKPPESACCPSFAPAKLAGGFRELKCREATNVELRSIRLLQFIRKMIPPLKATSAHQPPMIRFSVSYGQL